MAMSWDRTLPLDGQASVVVGVLPAGFHFDYPTLRISEPVDIYVSMAIERSAQFRSSGAGASMPFRMLARLREGNYGSGSEVGDSCLRKDVDAGASDGVSQSRWWSGAPPTRCGSAAPSDCRTAGRFADDVVGGRGSFASDRVREYSTTAAGSIFAAEKGSCDTGSVGRGRLRLIRQFVLEGLILALCGGALGLMVAYWMANVLVGCSLCQSATRSSPHRWPSDCVHAWSFRDFGDFVLDRSRNYGKRLAVDAERAYRDRGREPAASCDVGA